MKIVLFLVCMIAGELAFCQDTAIIIDNKKMYMPEVIVRNNFDYKKLLKQIKEDTTFYKAFRNLRILNYSSFNDIQMLDKEGKKKASLFSKTQQIRAGGCRTMKVLQEETTGDFYTDNHDYNYFTGKLYASLFFTNGKICNETNVVGGKALSTDNKEGLEKHKEQLKMLFFNPGKKIPGIPFIGNKLDLYDEDAHKLYDYRLDLQDYNGKSCYVFSITPKEDLGTLIDNVVVDGMTTWFDEKTLEVQKRNFSLSFKAGVYDFDVSIEVEMTHIDDLLVPKVLRYKGNWDIIFKKRERGVFTATLFDFSKE